SHILSPSVLAPSTACRGELPTRVWRPGRPTNRPGFSVPAYVALIEASSSPSSIKSSMVTMSSAPTSRTRFLDSMRSSPYSCATNFAPITFYDFGLHKGLGHLDDVPQKFLTIIDRFTGFQAQWLNVHGDFPLLQRIALPMTVGSIRYPGIKIHDMRVIRLLEVLLHGGTQVGGWTAREIHQAVLTTFDLSDAAYGLNQLRYDLRKLKAHALLERDGARYAYRLTLKGVQV